MAEDGKVVYKIEGDNSQALKAFDESVAAAKTSGEKIEETAKKTSKKVKESNEEVEGSNKKVKKSSKENEQQTEKTATAYEKLTQKIQSQKSALGAAVTEYKNIVLEQGLNSESAIGLRVKIGSLNDELSESEKRLSDVDEAAEKATGSFNKTSSSIEKIAKAIGSAFAVKQVIEFGKAAVGVASDLNEVQNVVDTTFGSGASKINEWAKNAAEAFGESELQAKQFTSTLGAMSKSMGVAQAPMEEMSMSLAGLAGDMASFYNLDPTEAFEKLRSGISGETEPLKQLGINMSVVNLEAFAMANGITKSYQEMAQAEQATLRYQYIMSATADAQGDFAETSDSFANQQRILKLELESLAAEIGQDLLPIALELVEAARDTIEWIQENKDALEALTVSVGAAVVGWKSYKAAMSIIDTAKGVTAAIKASGTAMVGASGSAALLSAAMTAIPYVASAAGIAAITAAVLDLKSAQESLVDEKFTALENTPDLADYALNGLTYINPKTGKTEIDFARGEQMMSEGTFVRSSNNNLDKSKGTITSYKDIASQKWNNHFWGTSDETLAYKSAQRHKNGEDFVMSDWTPAYLDYGERVLTASENAKYTAMGGVEGMERSITSGGSGGAGISAPSRMELGLKVSPREMAHAITPYVISELQAQGKWEDVK